VRSWLADVFGGLRAHGFDYFKLDFIYAGALAGPRHEDVTGIEAYRSGLALIREAAGADAYLLGCGAPILPSVGLVDAMRIGPDTYAPEVPHGPDDPLRGEACARARRWQHGRFWVNDADCLVARPSFARREAWAAVVEECSGLRSTSDRIADLDEWGLDTTRRLLSTVPPPTPFPPPYGRPVSPS
jgi:alpha-galactosidase